MSFDVMMHLIKTRHHEAKQHVMNRACPMVVIDANLIGYRVPKCVDTASHAGSMAPSFSNNGVGVLVSNDHSKQHLT